jgi:glycosyltransferase involved in cell wall biosynthesis
LTVAVLTAGRDKPYALGLAEALLAERIHLDFIGSDDVSSPQLMNHPRVRFLNLRGDQRSEVTFSKKALRVLSYYLRLVHYATTARPKVFHVLWNNKFEFFDRTVLMAFYRLLGKRIVFTAHNVNAAKRDKHDSRWNQVTLRVQYRLAHHIFVHTERMRTELLEDFGASRQKVTVIPFGINETVPNTEISNGEARQKLKISESDKTLLFFGNIAPYKGLEYLLEAFSELSKTRSDYRLVIAGRPKSSEEYWSRIQETIRTSPAANRILFKPEFIPDEETEVYFKAADVSILPYTDIFQSGVLVLSYSFGLPVVAADVGSLRDEIVEEQTGFVFKPKDPTDLARRIRQYFESEMYRNLAGTRLTIRRYAQERYSWRKASGLITEVYHELAGPTQAHGMLTGAPLGTISEETEHD